MATKAEPSAATSTAKVKNPQACLTGLPPELRVRIYGFVFSGLWTKEEKEAVEARYLLAKHQEVAIAKSKSRDGLKEVGEDENQEIAEGQEESNPYRSPDAQSNIEIEVPIDEAEVEPGTDLPEIQPLQHCCSRLHDAADIPKTHTWLVTCTCCLGRLNPKILSTNKLIYNEAMPVFYSSVELRLGLPIFLHLSEPADDLRKVLDRLPQDRLQLISRIVLIQSASAVGCDAEDSPFEDFRALWKALANDLPNLKHVRIHIDLDIAFDVLGFPYENFVGVVRLPKVQTVGIELSCKVLREPGYCFDEGDERVVEMQERFVANLEGEVERLGKRVEVTVS